MYEHFYGLREPAFSLTPDPHFLFLTRSSKEALQQLLYGIERCEGFSLIVGDVGTGKTTLCWAVLEKLEGKKVRTALVQNPMLPDIDILRSILQDLGMHPEGTEGDDSPESVFDSTWMQGMGKKELIDRLNGFLAEQARQEVFTVIIIDEAQNLSLEMLEQLRLLSNLETAKKKLLQIIFVGQLELLAKLRRKSLRQLDQRISIRLRTSALSAEDTAKYVLHRLAKAGEAVKVRFGRGAFKAIYRHSKGCPRLINLICDRALLAGYSESSTVITRKMVLGAVRSLRGQEKVGIRIILPTWVLRGAIITVSVLLLVILVTLLIWKGLLRLSMPSTLSSSVSAPALPPASPPPIRKEQTAVAPGLEVVAETRSSAAAEVVPEALTVEAKTQVPARYYLQVYSFRSNDQAKNAVARLKRAGFSSVQKLNTRGLRAGWIGVYVGPFADLQATREAASTLHGRIRVSPVIRLLEFD